ncbi:hypothetical protein CRE_31398 [Caenorhabditis remanei]|uniref:Uncharacterized protein n=1 Tax=Caenorhabditis remanei TaxID=31234 RepID=E3N5W8_CAERE|nr:hypothetical protein CRE_31398 [Caenorhabditis remanei]
MEQQLKIDNVNVLNSKIVSEQSAAPLHPPNTVLQPILFIVNPENVHSVMETVQKTFNGGGALGISAEASTQVQMPPFLEEEEPMPIFANTAATTTSFATQYDQEPPVTFCERGTMMNEQEPLNYFSPPYGAEFGDMTPRDKSQQQFDYSTNGVEPTSSSQQTQTRSFGTMFENVTTCNTGTSMIDESYVSEFLRDIETQTPSYMIQQQQTSSASTSANTTTAPQPSTSTNDWPWT